MSWVKLDDAFADHPKVLAAGAAAAFMWVCGLAYANRQKRRDGFIPSAKVPVLYPLPAPMKLAKRLVAVGLWEERDDGFQIHDYHEFQPSEDLRSARSEAGRLGGVRSGEARRAKQASKQGAPIIEASPKQFASDSEAHASNPGPGPDPEPTEKAEGEEGASGDEFFSGSAASPRVAACADDVRGCGCDPCRNVGAPPDLEALKQRAWRDFPHLRSNVYAAVASVVWVQVLRGAPPANIAALDCVPTRRIALAGLVVHLRGYLADPSVSHPSLGRFMQVFGDYGPPSSESRRNRREQRGLNAIAVVVAEAEAIEAQEAAEAKRRAAAGGPT